MLVEGIGNSYYSKVEQSTYTSQKNESVSIELADMDPNKRYQSIEEFTNDAFAMEKKLQVQYGEIISNSKVSTISELKKEISDLFPEYQFVFSKPGKVIEGQNLLYIDSTNLNKMLNDPSYRAKVYALMQRELVGTKGYHICGSTWKLTGTVFTLSEDNPKEGGIPYAGQCTGIQLDASYTFSRTSNKNHLFSTEKNSSKIKKNKKVHSNTNEIEDLWEKEKQTKIMEQIEEKIAKRKARNEKYYKEAALEKYEQTYDKYIEYIEE